MLRLTTRSARRPGDPQAGGRYPGHESGRSVRSGSFLLVRLDTAARHKRKAGKKRPNNMVQPS